MLDAYDAHELGVDGVVERIKQRVGQGPAYLTFDIDALDPAFAPGTGTPVAGGLRRRRRCACSGPPRLDFRGMDIVEVSPPYDHADMTAIAGVGRRAALHPGAGAEEGRLN